MDLQDKVPLGCNIMQALSMIWYNNQFNSTYIEIKFNDEQLHMGHTLDHRKSCEIALCRYAVMLILYLICLVYDVGFK